ncbi:MAG: LytR/AlgR family response regulator transcription factor [Spirosomataceae bacterium]
MKALLIEDEKRAQILWESRMQEACPEVTIVGMADDLPSGVKLIHKLQPDVVFLDIEMPQFSGLEILEFFPDEQVHFSIVFTTAYDHYAIEALKMSAVDYLLKPLSSQDLRDAMDRVIQKKAYQQASFASLKSIWHQQKMPTIAVPEGSVLHFLEPMDILFVKADNSYSEVHRQAGNKMVVSKSIKNFEEGLAFTGYFLRIHKSYLINLHHMDRYSKSEGGIVYMKGGAELPISVDKIQEFLSRVNKISRG